MDVSTAKVLHTAQQDISGVDEAAHGNVKAKDQLTILSFPARSRIIQEKANPLVEKLKLQNASYQTTTGKERQAIKGGKISDENSETLFLGMGLDGIAINKRMQKVNGMLDLDKGANESIRFSLSSILNTSADKNKFKTMVQATCTHFKTPIEKSGYKVQESIAIRIAEGELGQQAVKHGNIDLPEEKMREFMNRFFHRAIEEGVVIGPDGQPARPSEEELETWQKEFTKSFISYLVSENLIQRQDTIQQKDGKTSPLLSPSGIDDSQLIHKLRKIDVSVDINSSSEVRVETIAQRRLIELGTLLKRIEERKEAEKDLKYFLLKHDIIRAEILKEHVNFYQLCRDILMETLKPPRVFLKAKA